MRKRGIISEVVPAREETEQEQSETPKNSDKDSSEDKE